MILISATTDENQKQVVCLKNNNVTVLIETKAKQGLPVKALIKGLYKLTTIRLGNNGVFSVLKNTDSIDKLLMMVPVAAVLITYFIIFGI